MNAKNRNIPYGYKYEKGYITVNTAEAVVVNQVFTGYINGMSLLKIANMLTQKGTEYLPEQVNWNKNKIKRMIEDKRYLGDDKFPQIINSEIFNQANKIKSSRNTAEYAENPYCIYKMKIPVLCTKCSAEMKRFHHPQLKITEKWVCSKCSHSISVTDKALADEITEMMNKLILNPSLIKSDSVRDKSKETVKKENEINRMLEANDIDKNILKQKIFELASLKYADLESDQYISDYIKSEFEQLDILSEISSKLLMKTTKAIHIYADNDIRLILKNNQEIGKEVADGTGIIAKDGTVHSARNYCAAKCEGQIPSGKDSRLLPCIDKAGRTA